MKIFEAISDNPVLSSIVAASVIGLFSLTIKWYRENRDNKIVYDFLVRSNSTTNFTFRSTEAISSATNIPEIRVSYLCSQNAKIKRNEKEKQSWRLS